MALTILPHVNRGPSKGEKIANALRAGVQKGSELYGEHLRKGESKESLEKEDVALLRQGYDVQDIKSPELRKQIIANTASEKREAKKAEINLEKIEKEAEQKIAPYEGALKTVQEMRDIGKKGQLGFGSSIRGLLSKDTRKDMAKYTQLGKSLIQFASNIPIRNKNEFETLAHDLYDPSLTDATREGILDAMQEIIQNSLKSLSPQNENPPQPNVPQQQERPPLQSFMR